MLLILDSVLKAHNSRDIVWRLSGLRVLKTANRNEIKVYGKAQEKLELRRFEVESNVLVDDIVNEFILLLYVTSGYVFIVDVRNDLFPVIRPR